MKIDNRENKKIVFSIPILVAMILVLLEPPLFMQAYPRIDNVYNYAQLIVSIIIGIRYIRYCRIEGVTAWAIIYLFFLCISTLINNVNIVRAFTRTASFVAVCLLIEIEIPYQPRRLVSTFLMILEVYLYLNVISYILFPQGLYSTSILTKYYFLGYKNQMLNFILPCICFSLLNLETCDSSQRVISLFRTIVDYVLSMFVVIGVKSGASTVAMSAMFFFLIFRKFMNPRIFNMRIYMIANTVMVIGIVLLGLQSVIMPLISFLGKDETLTGRVYIWSKTMNLIEKKPIIGYGLQVNSQRVSLYSSLGVDKYDVFAGLHAHNRYLEVLYRGGIMLFIAYLGMLISSAEQLYKFRYSPQSMIIAFTAFVYLTGMVTEYYDYSPLFFAILLLGYRCNCLKGISDSYEESITSRIERQVI